FTARFKVPLPKLRDNPLGDLRMLPKQVLAVGVAREPLLIMAPAQMPVSPLLLGVDGDPQKLKVDPRAVGLIGVATIQREAIVTLSDQCQRAIAVFGHRMNSSCSRLMTPAIACNIASAGSSLSALVIASMW